MRVDHGNCLTCRYGVALAPADWQPGYSGEVYDRWDLKTVIRRQHKHQAMRCAYNPVWTEVLSNHWCGQYQDWNVTKWPSVSEEVWGDWSSQQIEGLQDQVRRLQVDLKKARERSRKRLERLEHLQGKTRAKSGKEKANGSDVGC